MFELSLMLILFELSALAVGWWCGARIAVARLASRAWARARRRRPRLPDETEEACKMRRQRCAVEIAGREVLRHE